MKRIVIDLDNTLCRSRQGDYANAEPILETIDAVRRYSRSGFEIVIHTSRNMRTFESNIGKINARTLPIILDWLHRHDVPYDEVVVGKPWCGDDGFYVDDRAVRPAEFATLPYEDIVRLLDGCR